MLRAYIEGKRFTIRADHDSLEWILNLSDATGCFSGWRLRLLIFEFVVVHRAGIKRHAVNALSRLKTTSAVTNSIKDHLQTPEVDDDTTDSTNVRLEKYDEV